MSLAKHARAVRRPGEQDHSACDLDGHVFFLGAAGLSLVHEDMSAEELIAVMSASNQEVREYLKSHAEPRITHPLFKSTER